jgi:hypothetical protein
MPSLHVHQDFIELVEDLMTQLEGSFALVFKSTHYPMQLVATRRGSPLLVGIKPNMQLSNERLPASLLARCAFLVGDLYSKMPLVPTPARLTRALEASRRVTNGIPLGC